MLLIQYLLNHQNPLLNFYATNTILEQFIENTPKDELTNLVFVAPDNGATGRRNVYLNSFNNENINKEAGSFVKQRDYNHLENGKYPVISHDYCGNNDLEGKIYDNEEKLTNNSQNIVVFKMI